MTHHGNEHPLPADVCPGSQNGLGHTFTADVRWPDAPPRCIGCHRDEATIRAATRMPVEGTANTIIGGLVVTVTDQWVVAVRTMIYNDRIVLMRAGQWDDSVIAAWCYPRGAGAHAASIRWDPDTEPRPDGWTKEAFDARHPEEKP